MGMELAISGRGAVCIVACAASVGFSNPAQAAPRSGEPVSIRGLETAAFADPALGARGIVHALGSELPVANPELALLHTERWDGRSTVRLEQTVGGLPVLGSTVAVRFDEGGHGTTVHAVLFDELVLPPEPELSPEQLVTRALALAQPPDGTAWSEPELVVVPDRQGGRLAYRIALSSDAPLLSERLIIDAADGSLLRREDRLIAARARVYQSNPIHGEPVEVELEELEGDGSVPDGRLAWARSVTSPGDLGSAAHLAASDDSGDFLYQPEEPSRDDPFSEINAYHHVTRASRWFEERHGLELDQAEVYVNYTYGVTYDCANAFYAQDARGTDMLIFGQWQVDYAYDSDVILHEHGHMVNHDRVDLDSGYFQYTDAGWFLGPTLIDEGLADYWSATQQDDSTHADYTSARIGQGRQLDNDHACPGDIYGEAHEDGQVVSGGLWQLREALGAELVDALAFEALGMISTTPTLAELGSVLSALAWERVDAGELGPDDAVLVDEILDERGLTRCGHTLDLRNGEVLDLNLPVFYWLTDWADTCHALQAEDTHLGSYFQLELSTPPASEGRILGIELGLEVLGPDGGTVPVEDVDYDVFVRQGEPVGFDMIDTTDWTLFPYSGSGPLPTGRDYDVWYEDSPGSIIWDGSDADPVPLANDTTYYLAITQMFCTDVVLRVTPQWTLEAVGGEQPGGCGCTAAPRPAMALPLLGALMGLAIRRRRG
jgi:MYXO-CTERM domain-containing protein